jgi:hypothetical protein
MPRTSLRADSLIGKRRIWPRPHLDSPIHQYLRNEAANEDDAVQNLIQVRARIDVQTARIASLDCQIKEQQGQIISVGNNAGSSPHGLFMRLTANRSARAERIFDDHFRTPFGAPIPKRHFIEDSRLVREVANLAPGFADYHKPVERRIEQLRNFGKEFFPLRDALEKEPDLVLVPVGTPSLAVVGKAA